MMLTLYGKRASEYARLLGGSVQSWSPAAEHGGYFETHEESYQVAKYSPLDVGFEANTDHPDHGSIMAQLPPHS